MQKPAPTDVSLHELIRNRWSPRAFSEKSISPDALRSLFEAARWAPSSNNEQPWAYLLASKDNAETKSAPPDSTDTQPAAEQVEEPSGPQTPAQTAARKDVKEAQDQVNFLSHNMATVQSRIDGETDEARKAALKDMLSNYTQQMGDAKRQLERTRQDLQRANQQAARQ